MVHGGQEGEYIELVRGTQEEKIAYHRAWAAVVAGRLRAKRSGRFWLVNRSDLRALAQSRRVAAAQ